VNECAFSPRSRWTIDTSASEKAAMSGRSQTLATPWWAAGKAV
jgi:hypothetical protein